jgi:hypothetical protein
MSVVRIGYDVFVHEYLCPHHDHSRERNADGSNIYHCIPCSEAADKDDSYHKCTFVAFQQHINDIPSAFVYERQNALELWHIAGIIVRT